MTTPSYVQAPHVQRPYTVLKHLLALFIVVGISVLAAFITASIGYAIDYSRDPDAFLSGLGGFFIGGLVGFVLGLIASIIAVIATRLAHPLVVAITVTSTVIFTVSVWTVQVLG